MSFIRFILTCAAICIISVVLGMSHYTCGHTTYEHSGKVVLTNAELAELRNQELAGKIRIVRAVVEIPGANASVYDLVVYSDKSVFEYGELQENRTAQNAKRIAWMTMTALFLFWVLWGIFQRWRYRGYYV